MYARLKLSYLIRSWDSRYRAAAVSQTRPFIILDIVFSISRRPVRVSNRRTYGKSVVAKMAIAGI